MNPPANSADPPMAEPGKRPTGADVGGVAAAPQTGVAEAMQRSMERREQPVIGRASTGDAAGGASDPRIDLGGKAEPGSAAGAPAPSRRAPSEEVRSGDRSSESVESSDRGADRTAGNRTDTVSPDGDSAKRGHDPDEPPDEGPIESLGRSVSEVVTGPLEDGENRDASTRAP